MVGGGQLTERCEGGEIRMTNLLVLAQARLLNAYAAIRNREEGQGMAEYAVLVAGVVAMVAVVVLALTGKITDFVNNINF
jgi:Flp pilus assembly pilin Flp